MRRVAIPVVAGTVLATTLAACGGDDDGDGEQLPGPGLHDVTIDDRDYVLYAPPDYDPDTPTPLVIVQHGRPGSPAAVMGESRMNDVADQEGFLVLYPDGSIGASPARELVGRLTEDWNAAPGEVYAAGFSAGGSASWRLAAGAADVFAAVASVVGPFFAETAPDGPSEPVSALQIVGLNDGGWITRIDDGLAAWREQRDCPTEEPVWLDEDETSSRIDATCRDGSEVVEYRIGGLPHDWPRRLGPDVDASEAIWEFFAAHRRG